MNDKELFNEILKNKEDYLIFINDDIIHADNMIEKTSYIFSNEKELIYLLFSYLGFDVINNCDYRLGE